MTSASLEILPAPDGASAALSTGASRSNGQPHRRGRRSACSSAPVGGSSAGERRDLHPAVSAVPSWSTRDLLSPPEGAARDAAPITMEKLRLVARQANINLPTPSRARDREDEDDDEDDDEERLHGFQTVGVASGFETEGESGETGVLRGVNEVLRFVQALDSVNTDGVDPMWTPLR